MNLATARALNFQSNAAVALAVSRDPVTGSTPNWKQKTANPRPAFGFINQRPDPAVLGCNGRFRDDSIVEPTAAVAAKTSEKIAQHYNMFMRKRRIAQIVVLLLLTIFLVAPVYEHFDHWDGFPRSGDDTVLSLVAVVTFCGVILVAAHSLFRVFLERKWVKLERWKPLSITYVFLSYREADESPPVSPRLSLRV